METPFDFAYSWIFLMSKSGVDFVKLTTTESLGNKLSQPAAQPSIRTSLMPCFEAKSIYFMPLSLVAPCLDPSSQVHFPMIIPHHMPIYLEGLIHDASSTKLGSLQLSIKSDIIKPFASSEIIIVRQGLWKGNRSLTLSPLLQGARSQINFWLSL